MKEYKDLLPTLKHITAGHIMEMSDDAICDYQDMIGHSSIEQLVELATGETYKPYRETFYRVYAAAYGVIEAIKFYAAHSTYFNNFVEKIDNMEYELDKKDRQIMEYEKSLNTLKHEDLAHLRNEEGLKKGKEEAEKKAAALEAENILLKARLYDLLEKKA